MYTTYLYGEILFEQEQKENKNKKINKNLK